MRYRLRTMLILMAVGPLLAGLSGDALSQSPRVNTDITAPLVYDGTMLVFAADEGVAAAIFRTTVRGSAAYDFRYEGKDGKRLEAVNKPLFESRDPAGNLGGELFIKAGPISIGWSKSDDKQGWIYYTPEKVKVHLADARDFSDRLEPGVGGLPSTYPTHRSTAIRKAVRSVGTPLDVPIHDPRRAVADGASMSGGSAVTPSPLAVAGRFGGRVALRPNHRTSRPHAPFHDPRPAVADGGGGSQSLSVEVKRQRDC